MIELKAIQVTDEYLDVIGAGATLAHIPEEMHDELTRILIGWVQEVRDTPWTQPLLQLPGS